MGGTLWFPASARRLHPEYRQSNCGLPLAGLASLPARCGSALLVHLAFFHHELQILQQANFV